MQKNYITFFPCFRICALFAIASLTLMIVSTLLATLGHCVRGHKMLLASGLYALGGMYAQFLSKGPIALWLGLALYPPYLMK